MLRHFIELAGQKVTEAQAKADEVQSTLEPSASGAGVDDLEAIETPESILLSTVSGEQSRDRTDRAIVTPWLKFLWETYRTVLEILKNNARLEVMYQATALQAFGFCQTYARKTEFRRLCELLRNHVQNAAKYQSQMHAINLSDPDTLQRHLDTRFQQLNVAVELELWQEAFRSVEDIHTLLSLSKRPAKNIMMANYYEKLTRIFLVSENYLFHAAAWSRYYNLLRQSATVVAAGQSLKKDNPAVSEADMSRAASFVLLSALSIPVISTSRSRGALIDVDEARKNKNNRLTNLLGMSQAPTRAVLFKDAMSKGLLKRAKPEIRELHQILEVDFHPLSICNKISPILTQIGSDPEMEKYVMPLQQVILTRLFQQLSQVYESVELNFVYDLAQFPEPFQVTSGTIEKFIMNGCKKGDLAIRIDHASGILTFDSDVFSAAKALHPSSGAGSAESEAASVQRLQSTPAEIVRSQLTRLAKTLYITCQYVDPSFNVTRQQAKSAAFTRAEAGAEQEHQETLSRRAIIEKKKELASDALQKKQKEEETRKRLHVQQLQEREASRLLEEQKARERKRLADEQRRVKQETIAKEVEELKKHKNIDLEGLDIDDLDSDRLRMLRIEQLAREKNELSNNLRITGKRIDHLERAFRKEEIKVLPKDYEAQRELDSASYEKKKEETLKEAERKHQEDVALKNRLSRLVPIYERFRKDLQERRHDEFEKRRRQADRELENAIQKRKRDVREAKAREQREREEAERRQREEDERITREAEEKAAEDAEKKRKLLELKEKRDAERKLVLLNLQSDPWLINNLGSSINKQHYNGSVKKRQQRRLLQGRPAFHLLEFQTVVLPSAQTQLRDLLEVPHVLHLLATSQPGESEKHKDKLGLLQAAQRLPRHYRPHLLILLLLRQSCQSGPGMCHQQDEVMAQFLADVPTLNHQTAIVTRVWEEVMLLRNGVQLHEATLVVMDRLPMDTLLDSLHPFDVAQTQPVLETNRQQRPSTFLNSSVKVVLPAMRYPQPEPRVQPMDRRHHLLGSIFLVT